MPGHPGEFEPERRQGVTGWLVKPIEPDSLRAFAAGGLTVDSRDDLPTELRCAVQKALEERLGAPVTLTFERSPAMAWGVELRGDGQRIGWTPDTYLDSLEEKLRPALDKAAATNYPVAV